ncbi:MAG: antitoxin [Gaiellales bacterium]
MPQLHLYVSDSTAETLRDDAERANLSLSRYLAKVVTDSVKTGWPAGYLDGVAGSCPEFAVPEEPPYEPIPPLRLGTPEGA